MFIKQSQGESPTQGDQSLLWPEPRGPQPCLSVRVSAPTGLSSHNSEPAIGLTSTVATPETTSKQGKMRKHLATALLEGT